VATVELFGPTRYKLHEEKVDPLMPTLTRCPAIPSKSTNPILLLASVTGWLPPEAILAVNPISPAAWDAKGT
jgi:hypothetical protein